VMAWSCRALALASSTGSTLGFLYWYTLDPDGFDHAVAIGPAGIAVIGLGAFGFWELLGRLLSWIPPWKPLPRFEDRPGEEHPGGRV